MCGTMRLLAAALLLGAASPATAEVRVAATTPEEAGDWAKRIQAMLAGGTLRLHLTQEDGAFPAHQHLRYQQWMNGVRVWGEELVEQRDGTGQTVSVFGRLALDSPIDVRPDLGAESAERIALADRPPGSAVAVRPELVVVPPIVQLDTGEPHLAWLLWTQTEWQVFCYLVDAHTGRILLAADDSHTESDVGLGTGTHGNRKKVSVDRVSGSDFRTFDQLRPASIRTYDVVFDISAYNRALTDILFRGQASPDLLARDSDNVWTDGMVVDGQAYLGLTYDYYFRRHGRHGLDDHDLPVNAFVHVQRTLVNAFWSPGTRTIVFGDGGAFYAPFTASLEVVAHEYTHGVTQFTWNGAPMPESGALNESFSDIIGTAVEWFYQPPGAGFDMADYWCGEDLGTVFDPPRFAVRAPFNPAAARNPDHFSKYDPARDIHANGDI